MPPCSNPLLPKPPRGARGAFTYVELLVACTLLALVIGGGIQGLLTVNRHAASNRAMTSARAIVQQNIETALRVPFSETSTPALLAVGTTTQTVPIIRTRSGTATLSGILTRTVTAQATPAGIDAIVRRVTFRLAYNFNRRPFAFQMETVRAIDQ